MSELQDMLAQAAAGYELRDDLIERLLDRLVGLWHEADTDQEVHDWIGIAWEIYAAYVDLQPDRLDAAKNTYGTGAA